MANRTIVFTAENTAEVLERPMPGLAPGKVLVRLARSTISTGTERANLTGVPDNGIGIFNDAQTVSWPRQCGYSSSGVVERVGADVTSVKEGDRVAVSWSVHAEHVAVPESQVYKLPEGVSFEAGALVHISTFPMAAIRKCALEIGESALVMGQGVLGQLAVMLLRAGGATPVIAADPIPAKRERALVLGADAALDPTGADFVNAVKGLCPNSGREVLLGRVPDAGPRVAIEVTGNGKALDGLLDVVAPFARVALLGCSRDSDFTIDYYHKVHGRGVSLIGAHTLARPEGESSRGNWTTRDDAQAFIRLVASGRVSVGGFVQEVCAVKDAPETYARLAADREFPVVQFDWTK